MYGNAIKELMKNNSFDTVHELAKSAGIAPIGLWNIVNNKVDKPQRKTLEKLCAVLGVTVHELKQMAKG